MNAILVGSGETEVSLCFLATPGILDDHSDAVKMIIVEMPTSCQGRDAHSSLNLFSTMYCSFRVKGHGRSTLWRSAIAHSCRRNCSSSPCERGWTTRNHFNQSFPPTAQSLGTVAMPPLGTARIARISARRTHGTGPTRRTG